MLVWVRSSPCSQSSAPEGRPLRVPECPGLLQDLGTPTKDRWGGMGTGGQKEAHFWNDSALVSFLEDVI